MRRLIKKTCRAFISNEILIRVRGSIVLIGICDDNEADIINIESICENYMNENNVSCQCIRFLNGKEVQKYCDNSENKKIDLLFLDVEMPEISGIELKDRIIKNNLIYRIVFVTCHVESIFDAFSVKTIGFINKPASQQDIVKMIHIIKEEMKANMLIDYVGYKGEQLHVFVEDIIYFEAEESYTKIYTYGKSSHDNNCNLIAKKLGQIEDTLKEFDFVRVHKSYLVNLVNVTDINEKICFRNYDFKIPIGRKYRQQVRNAYLLFGKEKLRKRI